MYKAKLISKRISGSTVVVIRHWTLGYYYDLCQKIK